MQQRTGNQTLAAKHDLFGRTSSATSPSPSAAGGMDYRPQYPAIQAPEPASLDLLGNPPQNIPLPPQVSHDLLHLNAPCDQNTFCTSMLDIDNAFCLAVVLQK